MSQFVNGAAPIIGVAGESKSIFRSKALRSYSDREQQAASYSLVTPRSLYVLWIVLALVVFFGVITWLTEIPVYTPATAIIAGARASQDESTAPPTIVVLVSPDQLSKLRIGQNVLLKLSADHRRITAKIFAVEPEVLSPQAARQKFDPGIQYSNVVEPKGVALARLAAPASSALLLNRDGSSGGGSMDAWVQTDSKPVVSLFPIVRRLPRAAVGHEAIGPLGCSGLVRVSHVRPGDLIKMTSCAGAELLFAPGEIPKTINKKTKLRRKLVCVKANWTLSEHGRMKITG